MKAEVEINSRTYPFEVRDHGGPPPEVPFSMRKCPKSPLRSFRLALERIERGVAVYRVLREEE